MKVKLDEFERYPRQEDVPPNLSRKLSRKSSSGASGCGDDDADDGDGGNDDATALRKHSKHKMRDSLAYVIEMTNDVSPLEAIEDVHVVNDDEYLSYTDDATLLQPTAPNSDSVDSAKDENSNADS